MEKDKMILTHRNDGLRMAFHANEDDRTSIMDFSRVRGDTDGLCITEKTTKSKSRRLVWSTKTQKTNYMITKIITNEQEIDLIFRPLTEGGRPAPVDGPVRWEILDGNSTLGANSEEGQVQTARSEDGLGTSHYKGTADADMGNGVQEISETYELVVIAPNAATVGSSFGEARLKTPTP